MPAVRSLARCCDKADCVSPTASTSEPTERSPSISWHKIASRCSLASAVSRRAASGAWALSSRALLICNRKCCSLCSGTLELHRNGEVAHAVDVGGREFARTNVDQDGRQQQPRRGQGGVARFAHGDERILVDAFLDVH